MAPELTARRFRPEDLEIYAAWFADEELRRRIGPPDSFWLEHVSRTENGNACFCLMADGDGEPVAIVQYDFEDHDRVSILICVRPDRRGHGYGKAALSVVIAGLSDEILFVDGYAEPDNLASLALLRRLGFEPIDDRIDDEGFTALRLCRGAR